MNKDPQKPKSHQKCKMMSSLFCRRNNTVLVHQIGRDMSTELLDHPCYQFTGVIISIIICTWTNLVWSHSICKESVILIINFVPRASVTLKPIKTLIQIKQTDATEKYRNLLKVWLHLVYAVYSWSFKFKKWNYKWNLL